MRIGYDEEYDLCMYPDNELEYDSMNMFCKEICGFGISLIDNYEHYSKYGIRLAFSYETELISIIEKMKDDRIERLLQLRNEDKFVRLAARVMIELWR